MLRAAPWQVLVSSFLQMRKWRAPVPSHARAPWWGRVELRPELTSLPGLSSLLPLFLPYFLPFTLGQILVCFLLYFFFGSTGA
jgi:hypothetical protein